VKLRIACPECGSTFVPLRDNTENGHHYCDDCRNRLDEQGAAATGRTEQHLSDFLDAD
jgi:hypothetical protein